MSKGRAKDNLKPNAVRIVIFPKSTFELMQNNFFCLLMGVPKLEGNSTE